MGIQESIKDLEERISKTKYNKKTQSAIGQYKAQLAKLKDDVVKRASKGPRTQGYSVKKSGDATVVILGFPSVGKSTVLNAITGAKSEVAAYEFTTLTCIPGVMKYNGATIQILDLPGIVHGAASGRGRGKEVLAVIRNADLILILIDGQKPEHYNAILKEIYDSGVRVNENIPVIKIAKKSKDGIKIGRTVKTDLDDQTIKDIMKEFKINNADVVLRSNPTIDQFIDAVEGNKIYLPAVTAITKLDVLNESQIEKINKEINPDLFISAQDNVNMDRLKELIFERLKLMRLYLKETGKDADMAEPMIVKQKSTIKDVCERLHKDFVTKFKFARVWGPSSKFPGQKFMLDHVMKDKDILEIHLK
ncbi:TPA: GTP-binding protein [Candidatus Woesearchaeota archaeon]|nr:GTP-binding protein [Candidatus Woesearchaeota archaeon]HIH39602.1 GTP-binding protein [Candidatus Woesearchaeota archaeon]